MKFIRLACLALACAAAFTNADGQGFVNLNFENATITPDPSGPYYPDAVYASNAIPGWTTTGGFLGPNDIGYNFFSLGSTAITLVGTNAAIHAIDGNFGVFLYGGDTAPAVTLSQTAMLPADAASIFFKAQYSGAPGGILLVSVGGQNIPFSPISTGSDYTLYGGDVSAFAGQSEQLVFSALAGENFWNIDDIQFSSTPVPEPNGLCLFSAGVLLLGWRIGRSKGNQF
jgi:hypothetical protein